jgi:hypothetical protein
MGFYFLAPQTLIKNVACYPDLFLTQLRIEGGYKWLSHLVLIVVHSYKKSSIVNDDFLAL